MMADTGLEMQGSAGLEVTGPPATWQFDFVNSFGDSFGGLTDEDTITSVASEETDSFGGLTDEDTVTSVASEETLAWSSRGDKQEMGSY